MDTIRVLAGLVGGALLLACSVETTPPPEGDGVSIMATGSLTGCKGKASSQIPSDGVYVITTFGGATESQQMSCGSHTQNGSWYYAASRQRYGCGSKIKIEANGKCVVAQTDDYGPDVCVENAAGRAIIDVSPMVAQELFGVSGMGWSDNKTVTVSQADGSAQLGACSGASSDPGAGSGGSAGEGGNCFCDASCQEYGDCCANCGTGGSGGSGSGGASGNGSGGGGQCYCDSDCAGYGDCCANCGTGGSGGSGSGGSGGGGGGGQCYCDSECASYGDCCANCGGGGSGSGGSGSSGSGGSGAGCFCDAECAQYGDCCSDCP